MDWVDNAAGTVSSVGGQSLPLLPAVRDAAKTMTGPARVMTDARLGNVRHARSGQVENYDVTSQLRVAAANHYAHGASQIADQQAAANIAAAQANRDLAASGVERGYRQQVQGVNSAYQLNLEANQLNTARAIGVAAITIWPALESGHLKCYRVGRRVIRNRGQPVIPWLEAGGKTNKT